MKQVAFAALLVGCTEASGPPVVSVPPPATASASVGEIGPPLPPAPATPPVEGAPAPAKQAIDPKYLVEGGTLLLGVTSAELWVILGGTYTVVIDRATGCATEGYRPPASFETLHAKRGAELDEALRSEETLQGIRDMVGVGRHVGARANPYFLDLVWSPDGTFIAFTAEDHLYRSTDGGKSFAKVDNKKRSRLAMSADGKYLTYQQGSQYFSVPADGSRAPQPFTQGPTFLVEMRPGGQAFFERSDADICADFFDLAAPQLASSTCLPVPPAAMGSPWPSRQWESVSPSGKYGIVKWEEGRKNLAGAMAMTYVLGLVDMPTKTVVRTVLDMRGEVDDGGNMVMSAMNEGGGDHTYYYPLKGGRRLLGDHSLMAWHDKTAIMSVWRKASLGQRKCDLVKMVKTP